MQREVTNVIHRAHALFAIKAADVEDGRRIIRGIATTPTPDRYGDVVESKGAQFRLPLPALWQHSSWLPVGNVIAASVQDDGIPVEIELAQPKESKVLIERLDEAWESVKLGLVRGLSIGFRALPDGYVLHPDTYSIEFRAWEWLELSLVTIPANAEATIQSVKQYSGAGSAGVQLVRLSPEAKAAGKRKHGLVYRKPL